MEGAISSQSLEHTLIFLVRREERKEERKEERILTLAKVTLASDG